MNKLVAIYLIAVILSIASLVGCSKAPTNPELVPYVTRFGALINKEITFPVTFGDIDQKYAGVCYVYTDGSREVKISSAWWNLMGDSGKEETVFHELGHCELGRVHVPATTNNIPVSIMYPVAFGDDEFYSDRHRYYIDELINNRQYEYGIINVTKSDGDFQYVH